MPVQGDQDHQSELARLIVPASREQFLLTAALSAAVFVALLLGITFSSGLPALDTELSAALQGIRSEWLDKVMVGITMLGDTRVSLASMLALLILVAFTRQWWLLLHLAAVFLAARLAVPILKLTFARDRPSDVYGVVESFSFPSGHAAAGMTLFGVIALIIIRNIPAHRARWLLRLSAMLIFGVAFSRVYLLAHWPSDVIAGLALTLPFVLAFGWQLQQHPVSASWFTPAVLSLISLILVLHLWSAFADEAARYLT